MDNDLDLYSRQLAEGVGSWGVVVRDIENEFRKFADIINELPDIFFTNDNIFHLSNDTEPIYPIFKFKTELNGKWIEDDGQEINEFLNQFKIIE